MSVGRGDAQDKVVPECPCVDENKHSRLTMAGRRFTDNNTIDSKTKFHFDIIYGHSHMLNDGVISAAGSTNKEKHVSICGYSDTDEERREYFQRRQDTRCETAQQRHRPRQPSTTWRHCGQDRMS